MGVFGWYGYLRNDSKLHNIYLGKSEQLTRVRLDEACSKLVQKIQPSDPLAAGPVGNSLWRALATRLEDPELPTGPTVLLLASQECRRIGDQRCVGCGLVDSSFWRSFATRLGDPELPTGSTALLLESLEHPGLSIRSDPSSFLRVPTNTDLNGTSVGVNLMGCSYGRYGCLSGKQSSAGGPVFDCQMGPFSISKVQADKPKWVHFRLSSGSVFG